ncbi:MAG TPA: hypothetical protein VI365_22295 [Trebonia sp.]
MTAPERALKRARHLQPAFADEIPALRAVISNGDYPVTMATGFRLAGYML